FRRRRLPNPNVFMPSFATLHPHPSVWQGTYFASQLRLVWKCFNEHVGLNVWPHGPPLRSQTSSRACPARRASRGNVLLLASAGTSDSGKQGFSSSCRRFPSEAARYPLLRAGRLHFLPPVKSAWLRSQLARRFN